MSWSVNRTLFIACCALAAGIVLSAGFVAPQWTPPQPQRPEMASLAPPLLASAPEPLLMDVVAERPLFVPGRRPPPPPAAVAAPPAPPEADPFADVQLVGLFGSGDHAGVILKAGSGVHRVRQGSTWEGWQLKAVSDREAFFASEGRRDRALSLVLQPQQGGLVAEPEAIMPADEPAAAEGSEDDAAPPDREVIPQSSPPRPPGRRPLRNAARS